VSIAQWKYTLPKRGFESDTGGIKQCLFSFEICSYIIYYESVVLIGMMCVLTKFILFITPTKCMAVHASISICA